MVSNFDTKRIVIEGYSFAGDGGNDFDRRGISINGGSSDERKDTKNQPGDDTEPAEIFS